MQGCSNLISLSLQPQFSNTKSKAALDLITCYAFAVQHPQIIYSTCSSLGGVCSLIYYAHQTDLKLPLVMKSRE